MDARAEADFVAHVKDLEQRAIDGDHHAVKTLACMALLVDGWRPTDLGGGGEVIDLMPYLRLAA